APARVPRAGTRPAPPRGTPAPRADRAGAPEERGTLRQAVGGTPGPVKVGTRDEIGPAGHPFGSQKRRRQSGSFARLPPPPELPVGLQIEEILGATGGALCALEELEVAHVEVDCRPHVAVSDDGQPAHHDEVDRCAGQRFNQLAQIDGHRPGSLPPRTPSVAATARSALRARVAASRRALTGRCPAAADPGARTARPWWERPTPYGRDTTVDAAGSRDDAVRAA